MSRARDFADLAGSADAGGLTGRNLIINGNFDVWQRGTSFAFSSAATYRADRWIVGGGTSTTVSRQSFTAGQTDVPNEPTYYLRWEITNNSQNYEMNQKIEDVRTAAGQYITISFWAKKSSGGPQTGIRIVQDFGSGGSASVVTSASAPTFTTSWAKYTATISVPSISGKTIGTGSSLWVSFQVQDTNTGTIEFSQVQAEVGETATPFEHEDYGTTLAKCQRYFVGYYSNTTYQDFATMTAYMTTASRGIFNMPCTMRSAPTLTASGAFQILGLGTATIISLVTPYVSSQVSVDTQGSGFTVGNGGMLRGNNDANAYIVFDAEL